MYRNNDSTSKSGRKEKTGSGGKPLIHVVRDEPGDDYDTVPGEIEAPRRVPLNYPGNEQRTLARLEYTDYGLAQRWACARGPKTERAVCYAKGFYVWDGKRWDDGKDSQATCTVEERLLLEVQEDMLDLIALERVSDATSAPGKAQRKALERVGSNQGARAILEAAKPLLKPAHAIFNGPACDLYLNTPDGIVNMDKEELIPHSDPRARAFGFTQVIPTKYDPKAECVNFDKFLSFHMCGKEVPTTAEDHKYIAEALRHMGFAVAGILQKKLDIWHGGPGTAKSSLKDYLQATVGKDTLFSANTSAISLDGGHKSPRAQLKDKRAAFFTEPDGVRVDLGYLKQASSGFDDISANLMHENDSTFRPQATFIFLLNGFGGTGLRLPDVSALWDERIEVLSFKFRRDVTERSTDMQQFIMQNERSGILNRILQGWRDLRSTGYNGFNSIRPTQRNVDMKAQLRSQCTVKSSLAMSIERVFREHLDLFPQGFYKAPRTPSGEKLGKDGVLWTKATISIPDGTGKCSTQLCALTMSNMNALCEADITIGKMDMNSREFNAARKAALAAIGLDRVPDVRLEGSDERQIYAPADGVLREAATVRREFFEVADTLIACPAWQKTIEDEYNLGQGGAIRHLIKMATVATPTDTLKVMAEWLHRLSRGPAELPAVPSTLDVLDEPPAQS